MKNQLRRLVTLGLAAAMTFTMTACSLGGGASYDSDVSASDIISEYPSDINEWTAENFNDYFTEMGVYQDEDYIYVQDHATYYTGTAVDTCGGYMDDEGDYFVGIFIINPDSTEADGQSLLDYIKENKTFTEDFGSLAIDHLVGNVAFMYGLSADDDFYDAMENAYQELVDALGVTPEF